jgi:hypothetical protein
MSADIEKLAVFDGRIVQSRPKYAVEKGALSLTNSPFNAISATTSQHTYNIYVPSENVFVDRAVEWSSQVLQQFSLALGATPSFGEPLVMPGRDFALCAFPLNALCSTMTATINDTTSVINTQDVLYEVLRLTDYKKNRLQRTCPTMLDKYLSYNDAYGSLNNPLAGFENTTEAAEVPNGSYPGLVFTDSAGTQLPSAFTSPAFTGALYDSSNGVPVAGSYNAVQWSAGIVYAASALVSFNGTIYFSTLGGTSTATTPPPASVGSGSNQWTVATTAQLTAASAGYTSSLGPAQYGAYQGGATVNQCALATIYIKWVSTEKLVLSPFVFSDCHEWDTGLFGINNIQIVMNMLSSPARTIRSTTRNGRTISAIVYNTTATAQFVNSRLNVCFLTPSLDVPLPPKSVVPYMEFPRYITQSSTSVAAGAVVQLVSQTITLPQIPDLFIIYAKPSSYGTTEGDWRFPVASIIDNVANPISINFDNFSGLLSSITAEQLYGMSVRNGLDMDYASWMGVGHTMAARSTGASQLLSGRIPTCGGILVLKPSQDITLQTGQAPSLVGNFTFQFSLQVKNTSSTSQTPTLYVITANSGFFESIRGSSRIIKGVLSEQDIISAPVGPAATASELTRMVGGRGMMGRMANVLSKAKEVYHATKPGISAIKGMLPEGQMKSAMSAVGYGGTGAGSAGAGGTGAGRRKGLSARLM